ncbi:MAG: response regulator [Puniceicoccaceae bacterium]|nr:MAG: response regulator [Puniceicoccaceae bacterium]
MEGSNGHPPPSSKPSPKHCASLAARRLLEGAEDSLPGFAGLAQTSFLELIGQGTGPFYLLTTPGGRILDGTPNVARLLGWPIDLLRGRSLPALAASGERGLLRVFLGELAAGGEPANNTLVHLLGQGANRLPYLLDARCIRRHGPKARNQPDSVILIRLQPSAEDWSTSALNAAPEAASLFASITGTGQIHYLSPDWLQLLGSPRDCRSRKLMDFLIPADRDRFAALLESVLRNPCSAGISLGFQSTQGDETSLDCLLDFSQESGLIFLTAAPSDSSRPADGLTRLLHLAIHAVGDGVALFQHTGDGLLPIFTNQTFEKLTGYNRETLESPEAVEQILTSGLHQRLLHGADRLAGGHRFHSRECRIFRADSSSFYANLHLKAVPQPGTGALVWMLLIRDVTETKVASDTLRESSRNLSETLEELRKTQRVAIQQERLHALGQMASGIAHDFNNLLAPILGFTELLLTMPEKGQDQTKLVSYLEKIRGAAQDGANVVSRLREFYRSSNDPEDLSEVDFTSLVAEAIGLTRHHWKNQAESRGIQIQISESLQPVPPVAGVESDLRQVLTNLILNAVDAMPRGGTIGIETILHDGRVLVRIIDDGEGMSEEVRKRCLEPFFTTKGKLGTGLGLSIVASIIQRHGGSFDLDSKPGQGTRITLTLPPAGKRLKQTVLRPEIETGRPKRILVVDDEQLLLEVVSQLLISMGHNPECFSRPTEALDRLDQEPFDLILLDRAMPGMTGDQFARFSKERHPEIPVIMLTGFGEIMRQSGERVAGVDEILSKPVSFEKLRETIARHG